VAGCASNLRNDTTAFFSWFNFVSFIINSQFSFYLILQPFVETGHLLHKLFLPRMYAVIIPIVAGVILLGIIGNSCLY
jgi:hypothetical protein